VAFVTKRPASAGDTVQFQTQWWLEQHGFLMPSVITVPGSRGELANALRLDLIVDDQFINCTEIVGASTTKTVLLLRETEPASLREHALARGIGVVDSLEQAINIIERLHEILPTRRGKLSRLSDWFLGARDTTKPLAPMPDRPSLMPPPGPEEPT
jgi:hypothetical protein